MNSPAAGSARQADVGPLAAIYGQIGDVATGLTEASAMLPSRCAGWTVADVLYHQLLDARRALIVFATPAIAEPDVDAITYWRPYAPAAGPLSPGADGAARHARHVRIAASAYQAERLAAEWNETSRAAVRAALACVHDSVATQGHALRTSDFIATLIVEAAVHYLDLTVSLPDAPPAHPPAVAQVRGVLEGLAGSPMPAGWDDVTCALKGTGRLSLSEDDRAAAGPLAARMPLFG